MKKRVFLRRYPFAPLFLSIIWSFLLLSSPQKSWGLEDIIQSKLQEMTRGNNGILKGIDLLYNEKYDDAEYLFQKVIGESKDKPIGYFYSAMVTWSRLASGFWAPETVKEYEKRIDRAIEVARSRTAKNYANAYDFFYLGGALGFKARFKLMENKWLSSFLTATEAINALNACSNMDPNNKDVLLGLGTFDYYTAHLSGVLKFLTYLLLHRGSKEEGLRKLNVAASEAVYSATEAKSMLIHIYLFIEEDFLKALNLTEDLARRYVDCSRYKLLQGVSYIRLGMDAKYSDVLLDLRNRNRLARASQEASIWERRALYLETIYDLYHKRYSYARLKLREILNHSDPESDPFMVAWPILKIGMSYDLEGNREEATNHYRQVLNMRNGAGAQFLAKKLLNEPPEKNDPFIGY